MGISKPENYVVRLISYFNNCSIKNSNLVEVESMFSELGIFKGSYDVWFYITKMEFDEGLFQIESIEDVFRMIDMTCYNQCLNLYTTRMIVFYGYYEDFSFIQLLLYQREERVADIMEEIEDYEPVNDEGEVEEGTEEDDDNISFEGDSSNMDSSESEVEVIIKKRKRIPSPNPPYRTRRKGRFSMLRGVFKNTEDNPVILDDADGPPSSQPTQDDTVQGNCREKKTVKGKRKKGEERVVKKGESDVYMIGEKKGLVIRRSLGEKKVVDKKKIGEKKVGEKKFAEKKVVDHNVDDDASSEGMFNSDDERMAMSSCDEDEIQFPEFN
ncbi:hypothetical protein POM88_044409 [Heracleum sosnowskyi]|uniref:Uncharacterized protein n=1 Tax=Heracleum sosnowskyi TaxID=360622 RepID=A0AAD8H5C9_9APIA|nr:hypothetical protein POM88_044409 [Heracleum sosnowskyi]